MSEFEERSRAHSRAQTDAMMVYIEAERRVKELKDENAKLRDLVELLIGCPKAPECDECKHLNGGDYACAYLMRELGFEVEE